MQKILMDPILQAKLHNFAEHLEVCDRAGKSLGHFIPTELFKQFLHASADAAVSEEELERRRQEPRGRSLAEILQGLGAS